MINTNHPECFIFSVYQTNLTDRENLENHKLMLAILKERYESFKPLIGSYKGIREESILVIRSKNTEDLIKAWCGKFNQETYLHLKSDREAILKDLKTGKARSLGNLKTISRAEAMASDAYTHDPENNLFWRAG